VPGFSSGASLEAAKESEPPADEEDSDREPESEGRAAGSGRPRPKFETPLPGAPEEAASTLPISKIPM